MGFKLPVDNPRQSHDGQRHPPYRSIIEAIYQWPNKSFICEQPPYYDKSGQGQKQYNQMTLFSLNKKEIM